ncbi:MAG: methyltransferase domain-containing protein [Candidatus Omnitrophota bacterium]
MRIEEYENIFSQEGSHWWYRSMRDLAFRIFKEFSVIKHRSFLLLDAGCGTGGTLRELKKSLPGLRLLGVDYSAVALNYCSKDFSVFRASVDSLPFKSESIDAVICLDVLYHKNVSSDLAALKEMNRILKKGGYLFVHLPAFEFLRGSHDRVVQTRERYTVRKLNNRVQAAGFKIIKSSYRHMFLFPFVFAKRLTENFFIGSGAGSDLKPLSVILNSVLKVVSCFENRMLTRLTLPFGSSVFCLVQKPLKSLEVNNNSVLYISYDGILDPVGESQVIPYLRGLSKKGVKVFLVSFEKKEHLSKDLFKPQVGLLLKKGICWQPLRYHKSPAVPATLFDILSGILKGWLLIRGNGIRIAHARGYISGMIACVLKALSGTKFIFDMRGFWPEEKVDAGAWKKGGLLFKAVKYIEKIMIKYADEVIVLTESAKDIIARERGNAVVIPCCVDLEVFSPGLDKPESLSLPSGRLIISYSGSAGTFYNFEEAVNFFIFFKKKFPQAYFLILANNKEPVLKVLNKFKFKTEDYSVFSLSNKQVPAFLSQAEFSLIFYRRQLSKSGCCPIKFAESLACGVPVIISPGIGDCDRLVGEGKSGVVLKDHTLDSYRMAIEKIGSLLATRNDSIQNCRRLAETYFSVNDGINKYLSVYEKFNQN